jgi:hypothetical protein
MGPWFEMCSYWETLAARAEAPPAPVPAPMAEPATLIS